MNQVHRAVRAAAIVLLVIPLQGCLVTKVVTVPVKVAYGAGKLAVKGTAAAVRAVVPDKKKDGEEEKKQEPTPQQTPPSSQSTPTEPGKPPQQR